MYGRFEHNVRHSSICAHPLTDREQQFSLYPATAIEIHYDAATAMSVPDDLRYGPRVRLRDFLRRAILRYKASWVSAIPCFTALFFSPGHNQRQPTRVTLGYPSNSISQFDFWLVRSGFAHPAAAEVQPGFQASVKAAHESVLPDMY